MEETTAQPTPQVVPYFDMIALTAMEASGVQLQPGDAFVVQGADTVRWLEARGAAKSASSVDDPSPAEGTSGGRVDEQTAETTGTTNEHSEASQATPRRRNTTHRG